ncbi:RNA polymerase sigma factor [Luteimonas deserti]|uniref:Sigma-70 family RNA polymerase sigma factor n=1 Tax=Luteimonas deserti TaxID=2752306 RepID=A0A7Z0TYV4_9GAMM|nr:sigma-70 family RNA polymerase sigma factor [Luteimonas deserti]NYZ62767.1 sigma-70 family RNA polymerase sigma factor [Luteimonas deserti]
MDPAVTAAALDDEHRTFARLLREHQGIVATVAASYCRDPHDRADLAQEIAAQLWRAWPNYDPARRFSTWMYRIALNVAISAVRSAALRQRHAVPFDERLHDVADPAPRDPQAEQQIRALHAFIQAQAPLDRALLLLYLDDRSHREMAEILGLSETNIATKISRLRQRIRHEL